jgi:carbamoylphosphate synthase large subunit
MFEQNDVVGISSNFLRSIVHELKVSTSKSFQSLLLPQNPQTLMIWNNKLMWKDWMMGNGLESVIARTYDDVSIKFPCVLKTDRHGGHGVYILTNMSHYKAITSSFKKTEKYLIEEALDGFGNMEDGAFGSALFGNILSLRCLRRVFRGGSSTNHSEIWKTTADMMNNEDERSIECGAIIATAISSMTGKGNYTGAFCVDIKYNATLYPKFLDINPRMCRTHTINSTMLVRNYVPLAFAIRPYLPRTTLLRTTNGTTAWWEREEIISIVNEEKAHYQDELRSELTSSHPPTHQQL